MTAGEAAVAIAVLGLPFAIVFGAGVAVGYWWRGYRRRTTGATPRQREYLRKLVRRTGADDIDPDAPGLTVEAASALIDRLQEAPRVARRRGKRKEGNDDEQHPDT